jgi:hypothetical protein
MLTTAQLGNELGFWTMDETFLTNIMTRLMDAASTVESDIHRPVLGHITSYIATHQSSVVVDTVYSKAGKKIPDRSAALPPRSQSGSGTISARLTLMEGVPFTVISIERTSFQTYCQRQGLVPEEVLDGLNLAGLLLKPGSEFTHLTRNTALPTRSGMGSIDGDLLPSMPTVTVKLPLVRPYELNKPPEYKME